MAMFLNYFRTNTVGIQLSALQLPEISDLVWISNGPKEVGFQMFWTLNGIWAQPFEIWTNGRRFVKKHLKSGHKCPDFEWLGL